MGKRGAKPKAKEELFWRRVDKTSTCWIWEGHFHNGSPQFSFREGSMSARQAAHELVFGVCSKAPLRPRCNNKSCVNPYHSDSGYKLSGADIEEIRRRWVLHLKHKTTLDKIGAEYGVTRQRIEQLVRDLNHA